MKTLKERAVELLREGAGEATIFMAFDLLQELVNESEPEPVLVVETEPGYWNRGHYCEGTKSYIDPTKVWGLPAGTKLYAAPPAPSVPEVKPAAWVLGYYAGYLSVVTVDGRVLPSGTALYTAPPAPSVPDGWRELCHRLYVELFHCDKQMTNTRDEDGEPVWRTGATVRAVLDDAKAALDSTPTPPEAPSDVARDSVASEPVGYLYTNLQSGEYHVSDYDDDYRGPERALWCIEPVYRRAKGQS